MFKACQYDHMINGMICVGWLPVHRHVLTERQKASHKPLKVWCIWSKFAEAYFTTIVIKLSIVRSICQGVTLDVTLGRN
jgi:hypothetical protein